MVAYAGALSVATTCTYALVIPTPAPLAVAEVLKIDVGIFFIYALICAFIGTVVGGIIYAKYVNKVDHKNNESYCCNDDTLEKLASTKEEENNKPSFIKSLSMLLVPILLILIGSFGSMILGKDSVITSFLKFIGDKNVAMLIGVIYSTIVSMPYIKSSVSDIMTEAADQVGLILLITGAGGAYGNILQSTGIADYIAKTLSGFAIPILLLCFIISQIIRCAQGSTTVALLTTSSILSSTIASSKISPILCGIAICAGGIGLSLPNDSGFWAISRFFNISVSDTIRGWTVGGFIAGLAILVAVFVLSLFQGILPGLV